MDILGTLFVLYVSSQKDSTRFYTRVLGMEPVLQVRGMTEFRLSENCRLGLMPEEGIVSLLGDALPNPAGASGTPRSEVYLLVEDPDAFHQRALATGAVELSVLAERDWGDLAAYSLDPDGHVLVFAKRKD